MKYISALNNTIYYLHITFSSSDSCIINQIMKLDVLSILDTSEQHAHRRPPPGHSNTKCSFGIPSIVPDKQGMFFCSLPYQ